MGKPVPKKEGIVVVILLERSFSERHVGKIGQLLGELRTLAMQQPGYITSQSLLDGDYGERFLLTSTWETWRSVEHWQAWYNHPDRQELENQVGDLQERPTCIQVVA